MSAVEGDPGVCTPDSLQYLIDELDHGRYTGRTLLISLQDLLTVRAGRRAALAAAATQPPPIPQIIYVFGIAGGGGGGGGMVVPRGRHQNDRNGEVITNPCFIQRLRILSGENTRGMCQDVALLTLGGVAF